MTFTSLGAASPPLWSEPDARRLPLTGNTDVDVVIVGAGYTGLWTAYYLLQSDPSVRVMVIDREHVGFGASGRNGGWASAIFPVSLDRVASASSRSAALHLQGAMNDTVDEIGRVVAAECIDADFAKQGFVSLARSKAQVVRASQMARSASAFGLPDQWQVLSADEARGMVGADKTLGGLYTQHCALIHPGKLVRGLAAVVERMGARIHEGTAALEISPHLVTTSTGTISAPIVVRATEGFTPQFKQYRRSLVPLYSLVLCTERLGPSVLSELNLNHRRAFNDMRHLRIYAQVTADGRIVFGGRGAPYHLGSKVKPRYDAVDRVHRGIRDSLVEFFPVLKDTRITHRWGGALGVPRDWHPSVGLDRQTGSAWAGPYVGDGVATSNLAGRILRNLILDRPDDLDDLPIVNHVSPRWEPEPLRWVAINLGLRAASVGDYEEKITGRPSRVAHVLEAMTGAH